MLKTIAFGMALCFAYLAFAMPIACALGALLRQRRLEQLRLDEPMRWDDETQSYHH